MFVSEKCVLFFEKVRLFSRNGVLFLFYFLINPTMTTANTNITSSCFFVMEVIFRLSHLFAIYNMWPLFELLLWRKMQREHKNVHFCLLWLIESRGLHFFIVATSLSGA